MSNAHIHLRMDNRTAVACQQDGRHSLSSPDAPSLRIVAVLPPQRDNTLTSLATRTRQQTRQFGQLVTSFGS